MRIFQRALLTIFFISFTLSVRAQNHINPNQTSRIDYLVKFLGIDKSKATDIVNTMDGNQVKIESARKDGNLNTRDKHQIVGALQLESRIKIAKILTEDEMQKFNQLFISQKQLSDGRKELAKKKGFNKGTPSSAN